MRKARHRSRLVQINSYELTDSGACKSCGTSIAGRFGKFGKPFGSRRIPVRLQEKAFL